jgi:hypothetical protein
MTSELQVKCLEVENWTRALVMRGIDREEIVYRISDMYDCMTEEEMDAVAESIAYARLGVLN